MIQTQDARPLLPTDSTPKRQILTIRMPRELHAAFRDAAYAERTSINLLAIRAIGEYLKKAGTEKASRV